MVERKNWTTVCQVTKKVGISHLILFRVVNPKLDDPLEVGPGGRIEIRRGNEIEKVVKQLRIEGALRPRRKS